VAWQAMFGEDPGRGPSLIRETDWHFEERQPSQKMF
jgi:hypothetical protein